MTDTPGWRLAASVAVVERDGFAYAAPLPDGPILVLEPVAATVWTLAQQVPAAALVEQVAATFEVAAELVAPDVARVIEQLVRSRVLEVAD